MPKDDFDDGEREEDDERGKGSNAGKEEPKADQRVKREYPWRAEFTRQNTVPPERIPPTWTQEPVEPGRGFTKKEMSEILRAYLLEGLSQDLIWDLVSEISPREFGQLKLAVAIREGRDNGSLVVKYLPVTERDAYAVYQGLRC